MPNYFVSSCMRWQARFNVIRWLLIDWATIICMGLKTTAFEFVRVSENLPIPKWTEIKQKEWNEFKYILCTNCIEPHEIHWIIHVNIDVISQPK